MRQTESLSLLCALALWAGFPGAWAQTDSTARPPVAKRAEQSTSNPSNSSSIKPGVEQESDPPFVIQSATRRVVVDVVVTGPDGKPVNGLTQRDFTVLEDRNPQSLRSFEEHAPDLNRSDLPPGPTGLPQHTFMNLEAVPASGPPVVVLLDFLNTPLDAQMYAHGQIERFLESKPGSLQVAIFGLGEKLSILQGFTTDRERLLSVFRSSTAHPRTPAASEQLLRAQITLDAFVDMGKLLAAIPGRKNVLWFSGAFDMMVLPQSADRQQGDLDVGREAGSPASGQGAVVTSQNLLPSSAVGGEASSSGFSNHIGSMTVLQDRLKKVATALAVSQAAVYPVDVRGPAVETTFSAGMASPSQMTADPRGRQATPGLPTTPGGVAPNAQAHNDFMQSMDATHATMEEIADATGGRAFENSNGIAAAANQAVQDGSSYYTLVYAPSNLKFDGGLRAIRVALDKPGYKLRYRSAYYAVGPAQVDPEAGDRESLSEAMLHGAPEAQGLLFQAEIEPDGAPAPAPASSPLAAKPSSNAGKRPRKDPDLLTGMVQSYRIRLAILAKQLQFSASEDNRHHAKLQIAVYAFAGDGRKVGGTVEKLDAAMPPPVFQRAMEDGMFHSLRVDLPVEATSLRLAVRDALSRRIGSLEVPLPLSPAQQAKTSSPLQP